MAPVPYVRRSAGCSRDPRTAHPCLHKAGSLFRGARRVHPRELPGQQQGSDRKRIVELDAIRDEGLSIGFIGRVDWDISQEMRILSILTGRRASTGRGKPVNGRGVRAIPGVPDLTGVRWHLSRTDAEAVRIDLQSHPGLSLADSRRTNSPRERGWARTHRSCHRQTQTSLRLCPACALDSLPPARCNAGARWETIVIVARADLPPAAAWMTAVPERDGAV
jgi:hypothetical protein